MNINEVIENDHILQNGYIVRDGFVFVAIMEPTNVYDTLVIRNPQSANCWSPRIGLPSRSLDEHIRLINELALEKACVIAENIQFITSCPSVKYLRIIPADSTASKFDFSPLYDMPEIIDLSCQTTCGANERFCGEIDYLRIRGLRSLKISGHGHANFNRVETLQKLDIFGFRGISRDMTDLFGSTILEELIITQCAVQSLKGIKAARKLQSCSLYYNHSLRDASEIVETSDTLKSLSIVNCGKISDFSFLHQLINLEYLYLMGSNALPDLSFLQHMKKLKMFSTSMNILDGDLSPCMALPYVYVRNRKHYNLKDQNLPKTIVP